MKKKDMSLKLINSVCDRTAELDLYCQKYGEWPRDYRYKTGDKETQGRSLHVWLQNHKYKYGVRKFNTDGILVVYKGIEVSEYIDMLYEKYSLNISGSEKFVIDMTKKILAYTKEYGEFPKAYYPLTSESTEKEVYSTKLYHWLGDKGFFRPDGSFIYKDMMYNRKYTVGEILLDAQVHSSQINGKGKVRACMMIDRLEKFCQEEKKWPSQNGVANEEQKLYNWLYYSKYAYGKDTFRFSNYVDLNGISLKERLDKLFMEYGHTNTHTDLHKEMIMDEVEVFTIENDDFPKSNPCRKGIDKKKSIALSNFLNSQGLLPDSKEFKLKDYMKYGITREELLKAYYAIFVHKKQKDMGNLNILNRSQSYKSRNVGRVLYFLFGEYVRGLILEDADLIYVTRELIYGYVNSKKVNINIEEILTSFDASLEESLIYHYKKYCEYSIENNNDLALMHKCLYEYIKYVGVHLKWNDNADISKSKCLTR